MTAIETDVVVLGAGTAGINAWHAARRAGARALLVDPGPLGTTCARVGCMPSKLLIASAERARAVAEAGRLGIRVPPPEVDGAAVLERVRRYRDAFVAENVALVEKRRDFLRGAGRLVAPGRVRVGDREVRTRTVVVATGSRPVLPPGWEAVPRSYLLTNEEVFELEELPPSLLVLGAGPVGLELGQAMARLGVAVTVLDVVPRPAGLRHPRTREALLAALREELEIFLEHELLSATPAGEVLEVAFRTPGGVERRRVARVLVAAGRRPRLEGLGLEEVHGPLPPVDPATCQAGELPVFLAGDVRGERMIMHEAATDGRIAGANAAAWPEVKPHPRPPPLGIVFTSPQVARVGEPADRIDPERHAVGTYDFSQQKRAIMAGEAAGFGVAWTDRTTGRLVGAELVGPQVEHLAHAIAWLVDLGVSAERAVRLPAYHPTLEEGLRVLLARARPGHAPPRR